MSEARQQPGREVATTRPIKPIDQVRGTLEQLRPQLEMALPKHIPADRLVRVVMTAIQTTPKLLECDRMSLLRAVMTAAQLGLEPDGVLGQAYLVPYGRFVQFIPGYKGLLTLARNSGEVLAIAAHEVREHDDFEFDLASGDPPRHTFDIRKSLKDRGDAIAFYAVARFIGGGFHFDIMTVDEVLRIRDDSEGYKYAKRKNANEPDSPWHKHFEEMGKKTVIRRIAKYLPMSVQKAAAISAAYDTGLHIELGDAGELVIDAYAEPEGDAPQIERRASQLDRFEEVHGRAVDDAGPTGTAGSRRSGRRGQQREAETIDPETGEVQSGTLV